MRNRLLAIGLLGTVVFVIFLYPDYIGLRTYHDISYSIARASLIFPVLLFFVLGFLFTKKTPPSSWVSFSFLWVPLTLFAVFLSPVHGSPFLPINQSLVSFLMSGLFVLISLIIVLVKSLSLRKQGGSV